MITNPRLEKYIYLFMIAALITSFLLIPLHSRVSGREQGINMEYEEKLFSKDSIVCIDIQIADSAWDNLIKNAEKKEYHSCDLTINGEQFSNVGIRAKGGNSLTDVAAMKTSDRFSFMIKFDKYMDGQTCYGLDKIALNNNIYDNTQMKDAVTYDMCAYLGLPAPLYNYAKITRNGKYFGCYLLLEPVGKTFCKRNYGEKTGSLYEPAEMMDDDGNLNYIDENPQNYSGIFDIAIFGGNKKSRKNVVQALKCVQTGSGIEKAVDIDSVLKFMAIQTIAVNLDGLTGLEAHNYYLYEKDGKITLIPWDYNLAYGGFYEEEEIDWEKYGISSKDMESWDGLEDAEWEQWFIDNGYEELLRQITEDSEEALTDFDKLAMDFVNFPIDTPFTGDLNNRRFFMTILEKDLYKAKYHKYLSVLAENYIKGGELKKTVGHIMRQIEPYVCEESNAFTAKKQYKRAVLEFEKVLLKKAESVEGQVKGLIPSTRDSQKENSEKLVQTDDLDISLMGGNFD